MPRSLRLLAVGAWQLRGAISGIQDMEQAMPQLFGQRSSQHPVPQAKPACNLGLVVGVTADFQMACRAKCCR